MDLLELVFNVCEKSFRMLMVLKEEVSGLCWLVSVLECQEVFEPGSLSQL